MNRHTGPSCKGLPVLLFLFILAVAACQSGEDRWTEADRISSNRYYSSQRDNREATRIINRAGEVLSIGEKEKVRQLTADALANARMVEDAFLDKVHPEFKAHFRGEFQVALELALRNLDSPDYRTAKKSEELFSAFVDWFNAHRDQIDMPDAY